LNKRLRIAINAQLMPDSGAGGIETVLMALTALGNLDDGHEEYVFIGHWQEPDWLQPFLKGSRQKIVRGPEPLPSVEWKIDRLEPLKRALGPLRPVARGVKQLLTASTAQTEVVSVSAAKERDTHVVGNFYENLGCDVIHFPYQFFEPCALPTIYNPHDLQHFHYPGFFEQADIDLREALYPAACRAAHTVVVASQFVKRDIVEIYGVNPNKIQVIPWAAPPIKINSSSLRVVSGDDVGT
jgi:glycosyltransferase involved in cell wall biosynthesis